MFRGRTEMLMLDHNGDGFRVNQLMTYKLRKNEEGVWRMVRWADDPLSGDCGSLACSAAAGAAETSPQVSKEGTAPPARSPREFLLARSRS